MSEYRSDVRKISKEVPFTVWTVFKWGLIVLVAVAALLFLAQSMGIISMNIGREITQHSQQYVETKVNLLNKLQRDWSQLDAEIAVLKAEGSNKEVIAAKQVQQKNIVNSIHTEAGMIPASQIPESVQTFIAAHPR
ncbi:MAG: hypothetical protein A3J59_04025 [Candidatus Buchananbacteria bacterium RIFCSPHIGHO2_02_FULL_56_16]|uniref:Cell division protein FtsL n=1 Tax=Candidatus Buchananbacteria bacterium RIFCSPHIGHO2_02_FULL_56_16 TaxID=1797542 RepID=A0A1G1YI94_9BACT|nr:MAG: hypothetical protein A3J59_04025 [Candidatus Buchananbacteria bacterium RIFCSPHIGHO2_02_FULL_56_16]